MMDYLVTGGAGFIGSHLVDVLLRKGGRVRVLDNLSSGSRDNLRGLLDRIDFIEGDIRDRKKVKEAVQGVDVIFHEAALRSVPKSLECPTDYHDVNVTGTFNLLEAARHQKVKKFVFASSSACYGNVTEFPQKEERNSFTISPYAQTKKIGEDYCQNFSVVYKLPTISLRYFNIFGPRQAVDDEYSAVIPKFITCYQQGESPPIFGQGAQSRDFTFVGNVIDANLAAAEANVGMGEVVNVACGVSITIKMLAEKIAEIVKSSVKPVFLPPRVGDVQRSHADISRLKTFLGVSKQTHFEEGLKITVQWFKEHYKPKEQCV